MAVVAIFGLADARGDDRLALQPGHPAGDIVLDLALQERGRPPIAVVGVHRQVAQPCGHLYPVIDIGGGVSVRVRDVGEMLPPLAMVVDRRPNIEDFAYRHADAERGRTSWREKGGAS